MTSGCPPPPLMPYRSFVAGPLAPCSSISSPPRTLDLVFTLHLSLSLVLGWPHACFLRWLKTPDSLDSDLSAPKAEHLDCGHVEIGSWEGGWSPWKQENSSHPVARFPPPSPNPFVEFKFFSASILSISESYFFCSQNTFVLQNFPSLYVPIF